MSFGGQTLYSPLSFPNFGDEHHHLDLAEKLRPRALEKLTAPAEQVS